MISTKSFFQGSRSTHAIYPNNFSLLKNNKFPLGQYPAAGGEQTRYTVHWRQLHRAVRLADRLSSWHRLRVSSLFLFIGKIWYKAQIQWLVPWAHRNVALSITGFPQLLISGGSIHTCSETRIPSGKCGRIGKCLFYFLWQQDSKVTSQPQNEGEGCSLWSQDSWIYFKPWVT